MHTVSRIIKVKLHQSIFLKFLFFLPTLHHSASAYLCLAPTLILIFYHISSFHFSFFTNSSFSHVLSAPAARPPLSLLFSVAFKQGFIRGREVVFQAVCCFQSLHTHGLSVGFEKILRIQRFSEEEHLRKYIKFDELDCDLRALCCKNDAPVLCSVCFHGKAVCLCL